MPIAVVSDLDVRALEYYDDNCDDRKIPKYWLKETLRPELENISRDVNYDAMATILEVNLLLRKKLNCTKQKTSGLLLTQ